MQVHFTAKVFGSIVLIAALAAPMSAMAQGTIQGAERGAAQGGRDAGPVGAVVGGTVGAVAGTIGGILGVQDRPRFRTYVVEQHVPSYTYESDVRVGAVLPEAGVTYYEMPAEYNAPNYRYTYVNQRAVIVDPRTHTIVQVVE